MEEKATVISGGNNLEKFALFRRVICTNQDEHFTTKDE
jgi:hypothetical protein